MLKPVGIIILDGNRVSTLGKGAEKTEKTSLFAIRARIVKIVEMLFFQRIVKNADSAPVRANDIIVFNHF